MASPPMRLSAALERTEGALETLRARHADGGLPLLRLPEKQDDLAGIRDAAGTPRPGASDIVILGTGGSSLGGQTLAQLAGYAVPGVGALREPPRVHFIDNLDALSFETMLAKLPLTTSRFVAISKSGSTAETLMQTIAALCALSRQAFDPRNAFLGISEPAKAGKRNGLRDLLGKHQVAMLDHDPGVGGRFSALTNVGLLPAADPRSRHRARSARAQRRRSAPCWQRRSRPKCRPRSAPHFRSRLAESKGKTISVVMAYSDRLERFTHWYVQLWAESLGKNGKGTTPVGALGPVDQHSQVQLYLGGPRDKLFTVVSVASAGLGPRIDKDLADVSPANRGSAAKPSAISPAAEARATADTLAKNGCPVRTINIARLDEASLGELLMHFMLETIVAAHLLGVDAFDQPAVEEGKVLAKKYLAGVLVSPGLTRDLMGRSAF